MRVCVSDGNWCGGRIHSEVYFGGYSPLSHPLSPLVLAESMQRRLVERKVYKSRFGGKWGVSKVDECYTEGDKLWCESLKCTKKRTRYTWSPMGVRIRSLDRINKGDECGSNVLSKKRGEKTKGIEMKEEG